MRFCLGVVLYNPTDDDLLRLKGYVDCGLFQHIYVYDNSPQKHICPASVDYCFYGKNCGLAIPYNEMIVKSQIHNADFLCLMDQDSFFSKEEMEKMVFLIERFSAEELYHKAVIAPQIIRENGAQLTGQDFLKRINFAINSGSFVNVKCLKRIGLMYDENIFLDGLDVDFCWSIRERKCSVECYMNSFLQHKLGYKTSANSFEHHAAFRYFLIAKNKRYIWKKHLGLAGLLLAMLSNIRLVFKIALHEDEKLSKVFCSVKGMFC